LEKSNFKFQPSRHVCHLRLKGGMIILEKGNYGNLLGSALIAIFSPLLPPLLPSLTVPRIALLIGD
jgi:hypothetical protein